MISNRCARKSLVTNCNSIISKNYLRFLVDSNEMAYEVIMVYHLHMPLLLSFFLAFSHNFIRQDITLRKKSDDLFCPL